MKHYNCLHRCPFNAELILVMTTSVSIYIYIYTPGTSVPAKSSSETTRLLNRFNQNPCCVWSTSVNVDIEQLKHKQQRHRQPNTEPPWRNMSCSMIYRCAHRCWCARLHTRDLRYHNRNSRCVQSLASTSLSTLRVPYTKHWQPHRCLNPR